MLSPLLIVELAALGLATGFLAGLLVYLWSFVAGPAADELGSTGPRGARLQRA